MAEAKPQNAARLATQGHASDLARQPRRAHSHDHRRARPGTPGPLVAERCKWQVENGVAMQNGEAAMGLMDRVKEQAALAAQRATQATQEAAQQGKAKLDQAQAKRRA